MQPVKMCRFRPAGIVLVLILSGICGMPSDTTTRSPPIGDTIKQLTSQLMDVNATSADMVAFDVRTPPKVKQQIMKKDKSSTPTPIENSHAGVAIPMDEEAIHLEESTKKLNFYKVERPTTHSGISTWILLSGQGSSTVKPPKKPIVTSIENKNVSILVSENINKIVKPIFKKRITTTKKPATLSSTTEAAKSTTTKGGTKPNKEMNKLNKIKASLLNSTLKKITTISTTTNGGSTKMFTSTTVPPTSTVKINLITKNPIATNSTTNSTLPAEAKDGTIDLSNESIKKKKPNSKRKKNKNRRRKPSTDKVDAANNSTKVVKVNKDNKIKPLSTQLYNYLSREVMPTVGVGLVGLMVTAGLASYFLYPFGAARRSYEVDRKDKEGSYYYTDAYSGGIAEEEAIGKVIAGMPANSLHANTFKSPISRNGFQPNRYRHVENRYNVQNGVVHGTVENVELDTQTNYNNYNYNPYKLETKHGSYQTESYQPLNYNVDSNKETSYNADNHKFVVGSAPKLEEATPAAVPEHGPRSLKIRRKRETDLDNEIFSDLKHHVNVDTVTEYTSVEPPTTLPSEVNVTAGGSLMNETISTTNSTEVSYNKYNSFLDLMKDLIHLKIHLGLELVRNATRSFSSYIGKVQKRLDDHYREYRHHVRY